jgi:hypothetical protein
MEDQMDEMDSGTRLSPERSGVPTNSYRHSRRLRGQMRRKDLRLRRAILRASSKTFRLADFAFVRHKRRHAFRRHRAVEGSRPNEAKTGRRVSSYFTKAIFACFLLGGVAYRASYHLTQRP